MGRLIGVVRRHGCVIPRAVGTRRPRVIDLTRGPVVASRIVRALRAVSTGVGQRDCRLRRRRDAKFREARGVARFQSSRHCRAFHGFSSSGARRMLRNVRRRVNSEIAVRMCRQDQMRTTFRLISPDKAALRQWIRPRVSVHVWFVRFGYRHIACDQQVRVGVVDGQRRKGQIAAGIDAAVRVARRPGVVDGPRLSRRLAVRIEGAADAHVAQAHERGAARVVDDARTDIEVAARSDGGGNASFGTVVDGARGH